MGTESAQPLTATRIVDSAKVDEIGPPSTSNGHQHPFGNDYIKNGAVCDTRKGDSGCILDEGQRGRLVAEWKDRLADSREAYLAAIQSLQFEQMLTSDDDEFPWFAMLILDIATAGITSKLTTAVKFLRLAGMKEVGRIATEASIELAYDGWAQGAERLLRTLSDKKIESGVRMAVDATKKEAAGQAKKASDHRNQTKRRQMSEFIEDLKQQCRLGFASVRSNVPATYNDAELLASFHSLDPHDHTERLYSVLLRDKLDRFKKSGVPEIGRKETKRLETTHGDPDLEERYGAEVNRDTRVVWVVRPGKPRELRYQSMDGKRVDSVLHPGGVHFSRGTPPTFGEHKHFSEGPTTGEVVPAEFMEAAISRHIQMWGEAPRELSLGGDWGYFNDVVDAHRGKPAAPSVPQPTTPVSATPTVQKPAALPTVNPPPPDGEPAPPQSPATSAPAPGMPTSRFFQQPQGLSPLAPPNPAPLGQTTTPLGE